MNDKLKYSIVGLAVIIGVFGSGFVMAQPDNKAVGQNGEKPAFAQQVRHDDSMAGLASRKGPRDFSAQNVRRGPSREVFEARLNLTQEQKDIAKAQREKSIEKIKPIMEQIKSKKAEIETVKMTKMAPKAIEERIAQLENEIRELHKQAHEIRRENMKAFEATLTEEQKKEMQRMKEEGRKRFEQERKRVSPVG